MMIAVTTGIFFDVNAGSFNFQGRCAQRGKRRHQIFLCRVQREVTKFAIERGIAGGETRLRQQCCTHRRRVALVGMN